MNRGDRPFGLMFHHFHDHIHPRGQGALSAEGLRAIVAHVGRDNILGAQEWLDRAKAGKLEPGHTCITFDDGLRCQFDVALPVLQELGLTAFWFVYSSAFKENFGPLEVYRYFRTVNFRDVEEFYRAFFEHLASLPQGASLEKHKKDFEGSNFLAEYRLYSHGDRLFRYFRDIVLKEQGYQAVMDSMIARHGMDVAELAPRLWMDDSCLRQLNREGHLVGLHSYSHPTLIQAMTSEEQRQEYGRNHAHLAAVLGKNPETMSHPCGFYNDATLAILRDLGVSLGFRDNLDAGAGSLLELPRLDHAFLMKEIGIYQ